MKPWTDKTRGISRAQEGTFPTSIIPHIANIIAHGACKLPRLMMTQVHLMCLHKSGKVVANGPPAPPSPNEELMLSTEVDSYLRAVSEASTGDGEEAVALSWPSSPQPPQAASNRAEERQGPQRGCPRPGAQQKDGATEVAVVIADKAALAATAKDRPLLTPLSITKMVMDDPFEINFFLLWSKMLILLFLVLFFSDCF